MGPNGLISNYLYFAITRESPSDTAVRIIRLPEPNAIIVKPLTYKNYEVDVEIDQWHVMLPDMISSNIYSPMCLVVVMVDKQNTDPTKFLINPYSACIAATLKINDVHTEYSSLRYRKQIYVRMSNCILDSDQANVFYDHLKRRCYTLFCELKGAHMGRTIDYDDAHYRTFTVPALPEHTKKDENKSVWTSVFTENTSLSVGHLVYKPEETNIAMPITPAFMPKIKEIFYNAPYTVVKWYDDTVTKVSAGDTEKFDKETGLAMCIAKRYMKALGRPYPRAAFKEYVKGANDQTEKTAKRKAYKKQKAEANKTVKRPIIDE